MTPIFLAAILISLTFAPLGCIVLWKRYTYFGDGISHASLLAGSLTAAAGLPLLLSILLVAALFTGLVGVFKRSSDNNSVISLISSLMLAAAIIISSVSPTSININYLLFGDIMATTTSDLCLLVIICLISGIFIISQYKNILLLVTSREIAKVHKVKVQVVEFLFLFLLSVTIFSTIKIVGALMVVSLLIIPPMTSKLLASTPFQMILFSIIIALMSNLGGIGAAVHLDFPTAPTVVILSGCLYIATCIITYVTKT